jgi:hypothetical protein
MWTGSGGKFLRFSPTWYCTVQDWVIHKKNKKNKESKRKQTGGTHIIISLVAAVGCSVKIQHFIQIKLFLIDTVASRRHNRIGAASVAQARDFRGTRG